jgi:D-alanyl-D-alanine carboxypeptidase (penicillin-binding protein 5/6)
MKALLTKPKVIVPLVAVIALFILTMYLQLQREVPSVEVGQLSTSSEGGGDSTQPDTAVNIPWPVKGSAAVAVDGAGIVGSSRGDRQQPIASLVKVMTAYVVLKDHPLRAGDAGAEIMVEASDIQTYRQQLANGESVVAVTQGRGLTQQDLLRGLLIPSGNNLAYMLANWSSGSVEAFVARMNEEAAALGMTQTEYIDPSGVNPGNMSTAQDQLKLAMAAMANPVFAGIVNEKQASLPVAGVVYNVNGLLGQDYLVGVKTGWTEEAGACFLFAIDWPKDDRTIRVYGVVLGQDTLADAFSATRGLIYGAGPSLDYATVVSKETTAVPVTSAWGSATTALPAEDVRFVTWPGMAVESRVEVMSNLSDVREGAEVGKVIVTAGDQRREVPLVAQGSMSSADLIWRLTRLR